MESRIVLRLEILFSILFAIVLKAYGGNYFIKINADGDIMSENYPNVYPHYHESIWRFEVLPEFRISLIFTDFEMESGNDCPHDYILIYDGPSENHRLLGRFCGSNIPHTVTSSSYQMLVCFRTDKSVNYKGFRATYKQVMSTKVIQAGDNMVVYILNKIRQQTLNINKWGKDITRSAVALFLYNANFFSVNNVTGEEIAYELSLQLMSKLVTRKRISTNDLALFINAMTVSCINPKNFFGINVVEELRKRIDNSNHTNPFFILTLCNAGGSIKTEYAHKLQQLFEAPLRPSWTGTQAMIVMALKCISQQENTNLNNTLAKMVAELLIKQHNNGTIEDLKTTALVIQALIATESYRTDFNLGTSIKSLLKDVKDEHLSTEEIYYILPIFQWNTLLKVSSNHCETFIKTDLEKMKTLEDEKVDERIQISIIIGDDMDFSRTWRIKVPSNYSLFQVLVNVSSSNPDYMIKYSIVEGKPYIARLASFEDSIEDGLFWFIYSKPLSSAADLIRLEDSPVDIRVSETDELILWYNSGSPPNMAKNLYGKHDTTAAVTIMDTTDTDTDTEVVESTTFWDSTYGNFDDTYTTWEPKT